MHMGKYQHDLRAKIAKEAKLKLSAHREKGTNTSMSVFEVAELLDRIRTTKTNESFDNSIFFSVSMN